MVEPEYLELIQRHIKYEIGGELDLDSPLSQLGIDSMATVDLLLDLETTFDIVFPDEYLTVETFRTSRSLWEVVSKLRSGAESSAV